MLRNLGVSGDLTCFSFPIEVQRNNWVVGFLNVTGRIHFTCFETLEEKTTKSNQISDGGKNCLQYLISQRDQEAFISAISPGISWALEEWMNMFILSCKELLRDYNPLQRWALRTESQQRPEEVWGNLTPRVSTNLLDQHTHLPLF